MSVGDHIEEFDGANNVIDYKGPSDPTAYGICPNHKKASFIKIFIPRGTFSLREGSM